MVLQSFMYRTCSPAHLDPAKCLASRKDGTPQSQLRQERWRSLSREQWAAPTLRWCMLRPRFWNYLATTRAHSRKWSGLPPCPAGQRDHAQEWLFKPLSPHVQLSI